MNEQTATVPHQRITKVSVDVEAGPDLLHIADAVSAPSFFDLPKRALPFRCKIPLGRSIGESSWQADVGYHAKMEVFLVVVSLSRRSEEEVQLGIHLREECGRDHRCLLALPSIMFYNLKSRTGSMELPREDYVKLIEYGRRQWLFQ